MGRRSVGRLCRAVSFGATRRKTSGIPPRARVLGVGFRLKRKSFSLSSSPADARPVTSLLFAGLLTAFVRQPGAITISITLGSVMLIRGLIPSSRFHRLVGIGPSGPNSPTVRGPLLRISCRRVAGGPDTDTRVGLTLQPLLIVVGVVTTSHLISFLLGGRALPLLSTLGTRTGRAFSAVKIGAQTGVRGTLRSRGKASLGMGVSTPIVLLPRSPAGLSGTLFILSLNGLQTSSSLISGRSGRGVFSHGQVLASRRVSRLRRLLFSQVGLDLSRFTVCCTRGMTS